MGHSKAPRPSSSSAPSIANGDFDDYMKYYKNRYREERHLARYDEATIEHLTLAA